MGSRVLPALEAFLADGGRGAGLRPGTRLGLVAHAASVDREVRHAADLLIERGDLHLDRLFGPEHGVRGEAQDMEAVAGATDPETGLPVVSLYGSDAASLRPTSSDLVDLDAIVYDLQDVGSRHYTFIYTLSHVMEAAGEAGLPVIVLDRPNPIGGTQVEGPVLDPSLSSFVGRYALPVRHGMTTGELARLFNEAFEIRCDLQVVPIVGWDRRMRFEDTGLPWVLPSPNMPTPATAEVYPGGCLVEGTNLSEGRGTTRPFELIGAPWLSAPALVGALRREGLPGVLFRAASFRPVFQKHAGLTCRGIQVHVANREAFRPFETYLVLLREAMRQERGAFEWRSAPYEFESGRLAIDLLLGREDLRPMLEAGASLREMESAWASELAEFLALRRRFLMYPD